MSATILRLPVRPSPRPVDTDTVPEASVNHYQVELKAVAHHLHEAAACFGTLPSSPVSSISLDAGTEEIEAALFHALTLRGCSNADRELRQMLAKRLDEQRASDANGARDHDHQ